jgi:hypothetical protein
MCVGGQCVASDATGSRVHPSLRVGNDLVERPSRVNIAPNWPRLAASSFQHAG